MSFVITTVSIYGRRLRGTGGTVPHKFKVGRPMLTSPQYSENYCYWISGKVQSPIHASIIGVQSVGQLYLLCKQYNIKMLLTKQSTITTTPGTLHVAKLPKAIHS